MATYVIKFYPVENAFIIDPAPNPKKDDGEFRWQFEDGDKFIVLWDKDVDQATLQFFSESNSPRKSPIVGYTEQSAIPVSKFTELKIIQETSGARWKFNFSYWIGDKQYIVDPEIQIGSGT